MGKASSKNGARLGSAPSNQKAYNNQTSVASQYVRGARFGDFHSKDSLMQNIAARGTQTRRAQNVSTMDGPAEDRARGKGGFSGGQRAPKLGARGSYARSSGK